MHTNTFNTNIIPNILNYDLLHSKSIFIVNLLCAIQIFIYIYKCIHFHIIYEFSDPYNVNITQYFFKFNLSNSKFQ